MKTDVLRARSRNDFIAKPGLVEGERDEPLYRLEVIAALEPVKKDLLAAIRQEAEELPAISISSIKPRAVTPNFP